MKQVELWLPAFWKSAILNNDFTGLTDDERYKFMDFMDRRFLIHEKFTPIAVDEQSATSLTVHDAMRSVKTHPVECLKYTFIVESYWANAAVQSV